MADILLAAAQAYREACKNHHIFTLDCGEQVEIIFKPQNFVHLAGLRKFGDIYEFTNALSSYNIFNKILKREITLNDAMCSVHYDLDARDRIIYLERIEELLLTDRVVWNFNPSLLSVRTRLKSKIVFFQSEGFNFYMLFGAAPSGTTYYPETFFLRYDDAYVRQQTIAKVVSYKKV